MIPDLTTIPALFPAGRNAGADVKAKPETPTATTPAAPDAPAADKRTA